jgi:hypothetical protein
MAADDLVSRTGESDTSSFVEHLRLLHFTQLAACMITLIAITSQETSSASRAYDQTNALLKANGRWHSDLWARALVKQRRPGILQSHAVSDREEITIDVVNPPSVSENTNTAFFLSRRLVASTNYSWRFADIGPGSNGNSIGSDFRSPDNDDNPKREPAPDFNILDGAIKIWNRLYRFQYIVFVKSLGTGWLISRDFGRGDVHILSLAASDKPADAVNDQRSKITASYPGLLLRQDLLDLFKRGPWLYGEPRSSSAGQASDPFVEDYNALAKLVAEDKDTKCYFFDQAQRMVLRAECIYDYFPLQFPLIDGLIPETPLGDFSRSFPDVDELAKHLQSLPLTDLQTFFLAEKNRAGDKVEFPIVKLPVEAVTSWGIAILIGLMGYFALVLREFSARISIHDKAWDVPWIGVSPDSYSRTAYVTSILFTLGTVVYLAVQGAWANPATYARASYGLAIVAALAVTGGSLLTWRKVLAACVKTSGRDGRTP